MRLIDADAFMEEYRKIQMASLKMQHVCITDEAIDNAPTVDAVPVVRCKDCKHWYNDGDAITWCNLSKWACGGNGFCLYAERKDNDSERD